MCWCRRILNWKTISDKDVQGWGNFEIIRQYIEKSSVCWWRRMFFHWEYYYSRSWVCSWKLNIYQRFLWRHAYIYFLDYQPKSKNKRLFAILDNNKKDKHYPFIITQSCLQSVHWWYEDRLFILFDWIKKLLLYNFNHLFRWAFFFCHSKRNNHSQLPLNWKHICINAEII